MLVLGLKILVSDQGFNPPSVGSVVAFFPPSIKDAEVHDSVERGLLPAGSTRLQRKTRSIEPNVDPLDEELGHMHIVVFQECYVAAQLMVGAKVQDFMNEIAAGFIGWVGLAGEDQLDRAPLVMEQLFQPFEVAEQQGGPFVGGKAPGEADGESFGVE